MEVFYSYAGVISDRNPNQNDRIMPQSIKDISWMLFIRQKSLLSFSFSAIITTTNTSGNGIFFHLELDEKDVLSHVKHILCIY
jgi:hypothetical protein